MGIDTSNCCGAGVKKGLHECRIPLENDPNDTNNRRDNLIIGNKIPVLNNITSIFEYMISSDCYQLLLTKVTIYDLISRLTKELPNNDLLILLTKLIDWVHSCDSKNALIHKIKMNINLGTKNLLLFLQQNINKNLYIKEPLCFAISEVLLIVQYFQYKKNNKDINYQKNLWENVNEEQNLNINVYNTIYYLINAKNCLRTVGSRDNDDINGNINTSNNFSNVNISNSHNNTYNDGCFLSTNNKICEVSLKTNKIANNFLDSIYKEKLK